MRWLRTTVGLTVAQTNQFRRELRGAGGECKVAKNTLARRAIADTPFRTLRALARAAEPRWCSATRIRSRSPRSWSNWPSTSEKFAINGGRPRGRAARAESGGGALARLPSRRGVARAAARRAAGAGAAARCGCLPNPARSSRASLSSRKDSTAVHAAAESDVNGQMETDSGLEGGTVDGAFQRSR